MNKPELTRCNRLLDEGFSLLTVGDNKQPNIKWKELQSKALTKEEFAKCYNLQTTNGIGVITDYADLECIDVDLKVFSTTKERKDFWFEFVKIIDDNMLNMKQKLVIYRTKNEGYHILYKTKRVQGNTKIARLKNHTEAVIESRGQGGYVFIYDGNNTTDKTYSDIDYISDADRELIWSAARLYNYEDKEPIKADVKTQGSYEIGLTPWDDFNAKNSILDIVADDFTIVRQLRDKYVIKRHGATSPHSGYVYKDDNLMYLFSTGTIYPHEQQISPYVAYTYKNHNGNFSEAAKALYADGYGDRVKRPVPELKEKIEIPKDDLIFPIDIFPDSIKNYILLCNKTLNSSIDYMGCSVLWLHSIIIGNSIQIEIKTGWQESANLWMCLVGKAGIGKTPSITNITFPLMKVNSREIKNFIKAKDKYEAYKALDKEQQAIQEKIEKPVKTQFIVNDITLEALVDLHEENKNGVGVLKDELAGWLKDMNKYRQGSDLEHWLSSWSGKEINLNRKTAKSAFIERAFIPVMGGIQPQILSTFYTDENKDNGFIDRMLFSFPELDVDKYNEAEMDGEYLQWYDEFIIDLFKIFQKVTKYNEDREVEPYVALFDKESKKEWIRIFNEITERQNSDSENEYMKSMLPKQKSYIPRIALIMNCIYSREDLVPDLFTIDKKSILAAEKLSKYFIAMAKKIKADNVEIKDAKSLLKRFEDKTTKEKIEQLLAVNPDMSKSKIAELIGISRQMVYKYLKEQ